MLKPKARDYGRIIFGTTIMYQWKCRGYGAFGHGLTLQEAYAHWRSERRRLKGYGLAAARSKRLLAEKRVRDRELRRTAARERQFSTIGNRNYLEPPRLATMPVVPWWKFWGKFWGK